jgi:hypothetical protein
MVFPSWLGLRWAKVALLTVAVACVRECAARCCVLSLLLARLCARHQFLRARNPASRFVGYSRYALAVVPFE